LPVEQIFLPFEQIRQQRVIYHAPKQTEQTDRPYEDATYRARLDHAGTDDDANDRKRNEGATTKAKIDKVGSRPHREGENNAAQLAAETAGSPEAIDPKPTTTNCGSRFPDRNYKGTTVLPPSTGVRPFHLRCIFSSDARKAVDGLPSSRNGLQARRICLARDQLVEYSFGPVPVVRDAEKVRFGALDRSVKLDGILRAR
jgi:hypothetical protein